MTRTLTCIQCPQGCQLEAEVDGAYIVRLSGNKCQQGETYARTEILHPVRTLTTTVMALGQPLKLIPVRTSQPVPKDRLSDLMVFCRGYCVQKPVFVGEILVHNVLGLGVDLVATRTVRQA